MPMTCPERKGNVIDVNGVSVAEVRYRRCAECAPEGRVEMYPCKTCGGFVCKHIELEVKA